MRKIFLLALIIGAAALLFLTLAPGNTALARSARNVLGSLRPTSQDPSLEQSRSVPLVPPIPPIHVHFDPPEIGPVEVDIDSQEIEQDVMEHEDVEHDGDADRDDFDHVEIDHEDFDLNVRAEEKIQKSFAMPAAHRSLEIDNVWGSIEVVGTSSDQTRLTANKSFRADSKQTH